MESSYQGPKAVKRMWQNHLVKEDSEKLSGTIFL